MTSPHSLSLVRAGGRPARYVAGVIGGSSRGARPEGGARRFTRRILAWAREPRTSRPPGRTVHTVHKETPRSGGRGVVRGREGHGSGLRGKNPVRSRALHYLQRQGSRKCYHGLRQRVATCRHAQERRKPAWGRAVSAPALSGCRCRGARGRGAFPRRGRGPRARHGRRCPPRAPRVVRSASPGRRPRAARRAGGR